MKKIIMFLMAAFMLSVVPTTAQEITKQQKKAMKVKLKEFKKEGWSLFASTSTIEYSLRNHYAKLNSEDAMEVVGVASSFKSKNVGRQMALTNACTYYAALQDSEIKGKIVSDLQGDASYSESEFDKFYAAFKRSVETQIKGEMKESFSIIRDKGNGTYEMQSFYVVDKNSAYKARLRALDLAAKESAAAQVYAKGIEKFIEGK